MPTAGIVQVLPNTPEESFDTPKLFTNVDKEDFEFTWKDDNNLEVKYVVKAGETKTFPKYLVNYAATHLTNKILKREAFEKAPDDNTRKMGNIHWRDEEKAKELSVTMVAKNFPETAEVGIPTPATPTPAISEIPVIKPPQVPAKCDICGFVAKSEFGLRSHIRIKHKQ